MMSTNHITCTHSAHNLGLSSTNILPFPSSTKSPLSGRAVYCDQFVCLVCESVCLAVCPRAYLWNRWIGIHIFLDPLWPWFGPRLATLRHVISWIYFKRLVKFRRNQLVKFDWTASLTGDRSGSIFEKLIRLSEYRHWRCVHRGTVVPASCLVLSGTGEFGAWSGRAKEC